MMNLSESLDIEAFYIMSNLRDLNKKLNNAFMIYNADVDSRKDAIKASTFFNCELEVKLYMEIKRIYIKYRLQALPVEDRIKLITDDNNIDLQKKEFKDIITKDISKDELKDILLKRV